MKRKGIKSCKQVPTSGDQAFTLRKKDQLLPRALSTHIRERIKQIHSAILTDFL